MNESYRDAPTTHPSLLVRVRDSSNASAWNEFVEVYGPVLFKYCRLKQLQECDAADVAQEVLTRLSTAMREFEYNPELGRFRNWLGVVTHREVLKFWRRQQASQSLQIPAGDGTEMDIEEQSVWNDHFHTEILRLALERIEGEFAHDAWQAFQYSWIENKDASWVAIRLQMSIDKVYVAKSKALKRLRQEVLRLSEDLPVAEN